jgi:hypothetical protein
MGSTMTIAELMEYHSALVRDRKALSDMHAETYKVDEIIREVQDALKLALVAQAGEDNPVVAALQRKIAELEAEACLYYRADGTTETLHSKWSVTERRKADARDLALLRAQLRDTQDRLAATLERTQHMVDPPPPEPPSLDDLHQMDGPDPRERMREAARLSAEETPEQVERIAKALEEQQPAPQAEEASPAKPADDIPW